METKISSLTHPIVKHFVKLRKDRDYRNAHQSCLIMGKTVINELSQICKPKHILTDATETVFKKITGMPSPEPCVAEFPLPAPSSVKNSARLLVIDRISDPGNLGTLLRTALALGWNAVFFLPDTVDPFNDKTLRASKGAIFHLKYQQGSLEELFTIASAYTPFIADLEGTPLHEIPLSPNPLLVLSHEAKGVSPILETLGTKITIPIRNIESLNVAIAGAIMMYHLCQKMN